MNIITILHSINERRKNLCVARVKIILTKKYLTDLTFTCFEIMKNIKFLQKKFEFQNRNILGSNR
jgi:hypothetical protein